MLLCLKIFKICLTSRLKTDKNDCIRLLIYVKSAFRRPDSCALKREILRRGKSGLHGNKIPDNVRPEQSEGKRHRKLPPRVFFGKVEKARQELTAVLAIKQARQALFDARPKKDYRVYPDRAFPLCPEVGRFN